MYNTQNVSVIGKNAYKEHLKTEKADWTSPCCEVRKGRWQRGEKKKYNYLIIYISDLVPYFDLSVLFGFLFYSRYTWRYHPLFVLL